MGKVLGEVPGYMCQKYEASMVGRMQKAVSVGGVHFNESVLW